MQLEVLTVRVTPDVMADIEKFALTRFPIDCPKCGGSGVLNAGSPCPRCHGEGQVGQRADAGRYLLQYALGQQSSPEAKAMAAVYANVAPRIIQELSALSHTIEKELREKVVSVLAERFNEMVINPTPGKRRRKR